MKRTSSRSRAKLASDVQQIALLAPFVAAGRINKMLMQGAAGKSPVAALTRMGAEKGSVAVASSTAMMLAAGTLFAQSALAFATAWVPWGGTPEMRLKRLQSTFQDAPTRIAQKGIAPIRKKVVANSRSRKRI